MRLAVIPARGGSTRIPRKNIRVFVDRPIIAYSIEAALTSGLFDKVIVSTDDEEIASVARALGAEVPFIRPAALADDYVGTNPVVAHAIHWFREQGHIIEHACCIYSTAPFIRSEYLTEGWRRLNESGQSFAFSVTTYPYPIQRSLRMRADGIMEVMYPEDFKKRSQDLEEAYHDAGQFYWGRADAFGTVALHQNSVPVILPRWLVQDIDTPEDWATAELMYRAMQLDVEHA
ncbi:MAG: pseudaminic acid cytidylyltransferase [Gammaproteobacteria bacterium]|nr:pseudaminic acid cytidylyltransferase [Gammaproteobacteria bacterium]